MTRLTHHDTLRQIAVTIAASILFWAVLAWIAVRTLDATR